jgi:hypothetical protein
MSIASRTLRHAAALAAGLALVAGPAVSAWAAAVPSPTPGTTTPAPTTSTTTVPAGSVRGLDRDALVPPTGRMDQPNRTSAPDAISVVDIVVGWTAAAEAAAVGGVADVQQRIADSVADANAVFARSGVNVRLRLVATARGIGTDPGNGQTLLNELLNTSDGQWDNLTALKERESADLLSVFSGPMDVCGQAYYPDSTGFYGLSVINSECAVGINHVFVHEIGHNLGAAHERAVAGSDPYVPEPTYGYGYSFINWANPEQSFHTVMSYGQECYHPTIYIYCEWIGYISNPQISYNGHPTGIPIGQPNAADNRTAINTWAPMVAAYRSVPNAKVRGDWTGEGYVDLLGRNVNGNLYLYRGNGTGSVGSSSQVAGAWGGYNFLGSPGDITGDGRTDLIARDSAGTMWAYSGLGRGELSSRRQVGTSWSAMNALATPGDMDLDGKPDLVARRADNTLHTYTFRADGSMRYVAQIGSGWGQMKWIIGMGDLNGDRRGDVVGVNRTDGCLYAYNTIVSGGLPRLSLKGKVGCGWSTMTWLTSSGDFNRDGLGDLTARASDGSLWFYKGRSGGGVYSGVKVGTGWTGMAQIL